MAIHVLAFMPAPVMFYECIKFLSDFVKKYKFITFVCSDKSFKVLDYYGIINILVAAYLIVALIFSELMMIYVEKSIMLCNSH